MFFNLDTEKCEDIKLHFDHNSNLEDTISEFCFGISAFYMDFCMRLGLDQEQARGLLEVCQSCMTRDVEDMLSRGLLVEEDEDDKAEGVSADEIDELERGMTAAGFSEEEISSIVGLVQNAGSMEAALRILKGIGVEADIDLSDFEDVES